MNEQNIMENNEVLEVAEEIAKSNSGLGWKIVGGVLVAAGVIYGGLKLKKKIRAKKEEDYVIDDAAEEEIIEDDDFKVTKKNK